MYQFIESICCLDGEMRLLHHHQDRLERTFSKFFPEQTPLELSSIIKNIPVLGKYKCRLLYGAKQHSLAYQAYTTPVINSLRVVHNDQIDYSFKSADRSQLDELHKQKKVADDVIIIRQGLVTDCYYANLAFFDGDEWWTPKTPLLKGIKREFLLERKLIKAKDIEKNDLASFTKVSLINALLDLEEVEVSRESIIN